MTQTTILGTGGRERAGVLGIAALVVVAVAVYLALKSSALETPGAGSLLPYQELVATLVSADQTMFADLTKEMLDVEALARDGWTVARRRQVEKPSAASPGRHRVRATTSTTLRRPPRTCRRPAWLLVIQEPDPQAPADPAPNDETHHRLPDGTVLHVSIWTHRFGGQIDRKFVRQPERAAGRRC